ncbi:baseplate J/gp47 family protein [Aeromonas caviae]|uniref:baseplate assembly protein n=1 Tax=Aeromonas caviae TaxID=648 RepID=UPI00225226BE|nr:baseplate J/gp47 family protein [Aeromonas caviae]MCX4050606.1 baseplate J/gp47 family protein [Aeromonas caviae]MCX4110053.1 baseplate J/gp47 family protein [Aeromonas caviae]MDX7712725.1 baseplate J/gp47 family protein [Aeromonas caviae]
MTINMSALPAPQAVEELDFETIFAEQKAWVINQWPHLAPALELESEPLTVLLQAWSYRELIWRARLNDALKASMLAWAQGDDLLNLAAFFDLEKAEGETDDQLRARCTLSLRALSTAGPEDSYRYHAIATDPAAIKDADAHNGGAGVVNVAVLARAGNGTPSAALLAKVRTRLNHKTIRPLTDTVSVIPAHIVPVVIDYQIILPGLPDDEHSLNVARQRLADYCATTNIIGGTITIADIYASLKNAGISNVILRSPTADITTNRESAPYVSSIREEVTYA